MKRPIAPLLFCLLLFSKALIGQDFIEAKGRHLLYQNKPYHFVGTNFWYGMNLGLKGAEGNRVRLLKELDLMDSLGIKNLRVMASSQGPNDQPYRMLPALENDSGYYNSAMLEGLDFLLDQMAKREMKAVLVLNNMWPWSGGFSQYIAWCENKTIPYPPPAKNGSFFRFTRFSGRFFKSECAQELYFKFLNEIVTRTNTINGLAYNNDPCIMAWQLANEPRCFGHLNRYLKWVNTSAKMIHRIDSNHLVSVGSEGNAFFPLSRKFRKENKSPYIDYCTAHIWVENWRWYHPKNKDKAFKKSIQKAEKYLEKHKKMAYKLGKPLILDEFGLARDSGAYTSNSTTKRRDYYYERIIKSAQKEMDGALGVQGVNFWAWGGFGRPRFAKSLWQKGDEFTGDPPFEHQGWYSVYSSDYSTLNLIYRLNKEPNP